MCGITGYINLNKEPVPERTVLERMTRALSHRGPDAEGFHYSGHVALGHRRLSIIDLAGGAQPMYNESGRCVIVYNGEIYNFAEIKRELEKEGRHTFQTHSDTEAIVHNWEEKGVDCLGDFNGMFAMAVWDADAERLFLARDRMGQKPLYWTVQDSQFIFASELKALIEHPAISREIDPECLAQYFAFEYVPAPRSIFKGVHKLEPGHFILLDLKTEDGRAGRVTPHSYWDIKFKPHHYDFNEAKEEMLRLYRQSVERRLISDVPLGVFLSGGIDSSSIVAMMAEVMPCKDIKTFAIGFREKSFDETSHAQRIVDRFGTDHKEEQLDAGRLLEILPTVIETLDEPFADPSMIPTFLLSEFTRRHVTVALGGDGGDELFAGYDPFLAHRASRIIEKFPGFMLKGFTKAAEFLPVSTKNISFDFKVKQFLSAIDYPYEERHFAWLGSFPPHRQGELFSPELSRSLNGTNSFAPIERQVNRMEAYDEINRLIYLYCKLYMQDGILVKVDRASMANSLEVRAPFLDYKFVEFINTLPPGWKLKGTTTKYILKKALEGLIPEENIYRRKKGFGIPIGTWFKGPLRQELDNIFQKDKIEKFGIFNSNTIRTLIDDHTSGKKNNYKQLWTLFIFQHWYNRYIAS